MKRLWMKDSDSDFSLKEKEENDILERKQVVLWYCWNENRSWKLTFPESWQDGALSSAYGPEIIQVHLHRILTTQL